MLAVLTRVPRWPTEYLPYVYILYALPQHNWKQHESHTRSMDSALEYMHFFQKPWDISN